MIKKIIKNLLVVGCMIFYCVNNYAQIICGDEIWMGWVTNEYNGMSYGAVANNNDDPKLKVEGYGRYQFKSETNLVDFLEFADSSYFSKYISYGKGSERLNSYDDGLPQAFTDYYVKNKESFINKQDEYIYTNYYSPTANIFSNSGFDLSSASPYLKGAILSVVMYRINNNLISETISRSLVEDILNLYNEDEEEYIKAIYDLMIEKAPNENIKKRFSKEKQACLEEQEDSFESHVGEILNKKGEANAAIFIRDLNNLNPSIFEEFLQNKKFANDDVLEWYNAVRTSVNYNEEFNISSGVLDFGTSTSMGKNIEGYLELIEREVVFKNPSNGTNIIYIPQNTSNDKYSEMKFGINNVAQGGASLACMSMAINSLTNLNVLPNDIIDKLKVKYGTANYFYDEEKRGNKNDIINAIAKEYGLSSSVISKASVISSLAANKKVVARVSESEFTKHGTFILLCGQKEYDGKKYVLVADPNIYHTRFLYNLYDIDYIADTCKGIFFEIRR